MRRINPFGGTEQPLAPICRAAANLEDKPVSEEAGKPDFLYVVLIGPTETILPK